MWGQQQERSRTSQTLRQSVRGGAADPEAGRAWWRHEPPL